MWKVTATVSSAVFLVTTPGVVAGLVPWWLTGWRIGAAYPAPVRITAAVLTGAGAVVLLAAFAQFTIQGKGTPTPPAPTEQLVVAGLCPVRPQSHVPRGVGAHRRPGQPDKHELAHARGLAAVAGACGARLGAPEIASTLTGTASPRHPRLPRFPGRAPYAPRWHPTDQVYPGHSR
jgi:hypothetical protein